MSFSEVLQRAFSIAWKRKALWLFALLAGGGYQVSRSDIGQRTRGTTSGGISAAAEAQTRADVLRAKTALLDVWHQYPGVILVGTLFGLALLVVFAIVGATAQGGLIHLAAEEDAGRPGTIGDGFRAGFSRAGSMIALSALTGLVVLAFMFPVLVVALRAVLTPGANFESVAAPICGSVLVLLVFLTLFALFGLPLVMMAERLIVLERKSFGAALAEAWRMMGQRRGTLVGFNVMMIVLTIGIGIVFSIVASPFVAAASRADKAAADGMIGLASLILLLPALYWRAAESSAWTVAFARLRYAPPPSAFGVPAAPPYPGSYQPQYPSAPPAPPAYPGDAPQPYPDAYPPAPPAPPEAPAPPVE